MIVLNADLKFKNRILAYIKELKDQVKSQVHCVIHQPVGPVCELQGVQQRVCDVIQMSQYQHLEGFHDSRGQCDGSIVL